MRRARRADATTRGVRVALGIALLAGLVACSPGSEAPTAPFQARFAVRGRWEGERVLRVHVEHEPGPLPRAELEAAVRAALEVWRAAGACEGSLVATRAEANLVLGWRRGAHGECVPFGADPSVAHAGPVGPGSFVHLDAGRTWREGELSLRHALLHELGHVLGLDHGPDEASVMYPEPRPTLGVPGRSDRAALRALYGVGADDMPGSLAVRRADGTAALVLPAVAPSGLVEFACFDTDGDGDAELLTWRVDGAPEAGGALWSFHFGPGPVLERTLGPLYGISSPGAELAFARNADGARWLVARSATGAARHLRLDASGLPGAPEEEASVPEELLGASAEGDLDGDGRPETVTRAP